MSGPRCDCMLAGTALALLLAAPFGVCAQEAAKSPAVASPASEASPPPAIPAGEPPMASINTDPAAPTAPAAATRAIFEFACVGGGLSAHPYFNRCTQYAIDHPRSPSASNSVASSFFSMLAITTK